MRAVLTLVGRNVWMKATPAQWRAIYAAATAESSTMGQYLMRAALREIHRAKETGAA